MGATLGPDHVGALIDKIEETIDWMMDGDSVICFCHNLAGKLLIDQNNGVRWENSFV